MISILKTSETFWMNVLLNSVSVIPGQWVGDNERLCAMGSCLRLKRSSTRVGLESSTARSVGQRLTGFWVFLNSYILVVHAYEIGPKQKQGRGLVDRKLVQAPPPPPPPTTTTTFPPVILLLASFFFNDFRCGVLLFMVILVIYKYKNR